MTRKSRPGKHRQGASAVEFAMIAAPFFFMMFAILELGLVFMKDSVLQNAMMESGRLIRTGQADNQIIDETEFKQELCDRMSVFSTGCGDAAKIDVREIPQFRNPEPPNPFQADGSFNESVLDYDLGDPGSLMLVRVWYEHQLVTPLLSQALARTADGKMLMSSTTSFRNEPYQALASGT